MCVRVHYFTTKTHDMMLAYLYSVVPNKCSFEWTDNSSDSDDDTHCEIHKVAGNRYNHPSQDRSDTTCCWRVSNAPDAPVQSGTVSTPRPTPDPTQAPTPRPTPAPTEPKKDKDKKDKAGKRQRDRVRHFLRSLRFADDKEEEEDQVADNNFF